MANSQSQKTVLIATDNLHEAEFIAQELEIQGYNIVFSEFNGESLKGTPIQPPEAVLFVFSNYIEQTPSIVKALKKHFSSKVPPFIGALSSNKNIDDSTFDSVIFPPAHVAQIANRVSSMIRLGQMEREVNRRIITLKEDFDIDYALPETALIKPFRILFIGKATPEFMVIINSLQKKNVEVIAAFTSFSAFDYLHDGSFDAVVMNALTDSEPALTISETMRRNAKLYHVPTLFLVDSETFDAHDIAYKKGARDIISAQSETLEISGRILELANYHRIHSLLKEEFHSLKKYIDDESDVFNETFFRAHLQRVTETMKISSEKLTLIAIKATPNARSKISADKIKDAMAQVDQMLKNLVRMQNMTARLTENIFIISFPEQGIETVRNVIERIDGIVDCAAFDSGDPKSGAFTISLDTAIVEYMGHESSESLIALALAELTGQPENQLKAS